MNSNIKIGFVHPALMDYRIELFEMLNSEYDITFLFTKQGRGQSNVKENHLNPPGWKYKTLKTDFIILNRDLGMYSKLINELLFGRYDVLLVSNSWYICWPIAKLTHKKFIYWTEFWHWENTSLVRRILNSLTFFISKNADAVIATGTKAAKAQMDIGVEKGKVFTYPQCSVDYSITCRNDLREELNIQNKKIILYVGRVVEQKGLPSLIKALSLVNQCVDNAFLIVIGTGPLEKFCKNLCKEMGIENILFLGYVSENDKASYYKTCDLFVLPSIFTGSQYEPWGLVINEAMAFGKPIITTDAVGAELDMVENGINGYVVKNGDSFELSKAILKIISDKELEKKMSINSKRIFEEKNSSKKLFLEFKQCIDFVCQ